MIIFLTSFRIAWRSLMLNKTRSFLTVLGLLIGVSSVITIVSAGEGIKHYFKAEINKLGDNILFVVPTRPQRSGSNMGMFSRKPFNNDDITALRKHGTLLSSVTPQASGSFLVKYRDKNIFGDIEGTPNQKFDGTDTEVNLGRIWSRQEELGRQRVVVLGSKIVTDLFSKDQNPIGENIKIKGINYKIIGTLKEKGRLGGGPDVDKTLYIPLPTMQTTLMGSDDIYWITIMVARTGNREIQDIMADAKEQVSLILRKQRRVTNPTLDSFKIIEPSTFLDMGTSFINALVMIFGVIAVISLVVGGVGVMNIMLVSVTERTREIGLRKAIGAKPLVIQIQFLIEAMTLTLLGGVLGMVFGLIFAKLLSPLLKIFGSSSISPVIPWNYVIISMLVSLGIGLVFGFYPAVRASQLDPIESLRYE